MTLRELQSWRVGCDAEYCDKTVNAYYLHGEDELYAWLREVGWEIVTFTQAGRKIFCPTHAEVWKQ